ncbi:PLC-like phosphodiesterase [Pyrenochaeta sp. DS3sAY3a]|nr:PLC-like phosphodiesterase [Pyrenochaeta sp. DS3sAY3a]
MQLLFWLVSLQCLQAQISPSLLPPTFNSLLTLSSSETSLASGTSTLQNDTTTTTVAVTAIVGLTHSTTSNTNPTSATISASPIPSNTRRCNGYVEFCERKFSNISMVVAHNSPFVRPHNLASNQLYPVLNQLNDGIRGLQFETHKPNASSPIRLCHTSCSLLDAGTLEAYLSTVKSWLDTHPYEVLTIIMGNNNGDPTRIPASDYLGPFLASGILPYIYTPPAPSLNLSSWPSLAEMILRGTRVVVLLDYNANQTALPWLLDEFAYAWETPFSPTDASFPCTQQRPPNQTAATSSERMYMANHNLNIEISIAGLDRILIPAYALLDEVNGVAGNGSLGLSVQRCEGVWGRPPNWLLVDYYNFGGFNGSVFEVAAQANGVVYQRGDCCGGEVVSEGVIGLKRRGVVGVLVVLFGAWLVML